MEKVLLYKGERPEARSEGGPGSSEGSRTSICCRLSTKLQGKRTEGRCVAWEGGGEDAYVALTHQESPAGRGSGAAGGERRARPRARPAGGQRGAGAPAPRGTFLSRIQRRHAWGGSAFRAVMLELQSITVRTLGNILETFIK